MQLISGSKVFLILLAPSAAFLRGQVHSTFSGTSSPAKIIVADSPVSSLSPARSKAGSALLQRDSVGASTDKGQFFNAVSEQDAADAAEAAVEEDEQGDDVSLDDDKSDTEDGDDDTSSVDDSGSNHVATTTSAPVDMLHKSLWSYTPFNGKRLHLRAEPNTASEKTQERLSPGDNFLVSEERRDASTGITYLRLADGRGWAFDRASGKAGALCTKESVWRYAPFNGLRLHLRIGPDVKAAKVTERLQPGEVFLVSEERIGSDGVMYLHLLDGRGWAFDRVPDSGSMCTRESSEAAISKFVQNISGAAVTDGAEVVAAVDNDEDEAAKQHFSDVDAFLRSTDDVGGASNISRRFNHERAPIAQAPIPKVVRSNISSPIRKAVRSNRSSHINGTEANKPAKASPCSKAAPTTTTMTVTGTLTDRMIALRALSPLAPARLAAKSGKSNRSSSDVMPASLSDWLPEIDGKADWSLLASLAAPASDKATYAREMREAQSKEEKEEVPMNKEKVKKFPMQPQDLGSGVSSFEPWLPGECGDAVRSIAASNPTASEPKSWEIHTGMFLRKSEEQGMRDLTRKLRLNIMAFLATQDLDRAKLHIWTDVSIGEIAGRYLWEALEPLMEREDYARAIVVSTFNSSQEFSKVWLEDDCAEVASYGDSADNKAGKGNSDSGDDSAKDEKDGDDDWVEDVNEIGLALNKRYNSDDALASKSDLFRAVILHNYGGAWMDADVLLLQDVAPLMGKDWAYLGQTLPEFFVNGAMLSTSKPQSPFMALYMRRVLAAEGQDQNLYRFGPQILSDMARNQTERSTFHILPTCFFDPYWSYEPGVVPWDQFFSHAAPLRRLKYLCHSNPGSFAYHWHGRWESPIDVGSVADIMEHALSWRLELRSLTEDIAGTPRINQDDRLWLMKLFQGNPSVPERLTVLIRENHPGPFNIHSLVENHPQP